MRSLFLRWSVAVVVGLLWGAIVPPAASRIGPRVSPTRSDCDRVILGRMHRDSGHDWRNPVSP